ncbi:hypothetical protein [Streptomyces sp. NBC_01180]|uniref:hypothetical protein n=1 Tax=Streptomyces sp. NBC_01180 TaxID=2903763 RepID=UPI00386942E1|nr:hypothetical protein OG708_08935 [Streptomyces sp. NBC_01180]
MDTTVNKPLSARQLEALHFVYRNQWSVCGLRELSDAGFHGATLNTLTGSLKFRPEPYIRRVTWDDGRQGFAVTALGRTTLRKAGHRA